MTLSEAELFQAFEDAAAGIEKLGPRGAVLLAPYLYVPDPRIAAYVDELVNLSEKIRGLPRGKERSAAEARAGRLMEIVATLAMNSLRGASHLKSYQSAGAQIDLLAGSSMSPLWCRCIDNVLGKNKKARYQVLVEAKATASRVDNATFLRMCGVIVNHLRQHVGIGVFFTLNGATGFPKPGGSALRKVHDARLEQLLFYVRTGIPIVVIDRHDLAELKTPGGLILLFKQKISEISEKTGRRLSAADFVDCILPPHLATIPDKPE